MAKKLYTTHAEEYDKAIQNNLYNAHYDRPSLLGMLPDIKDLDILDMGCGSGVYSEKLLEMGAKEVTAIDLSQEMISIVEKKLGDKIFKAYTQDLSCGLPYEEKDSFDLVISPLTIHYIENLQKLFKEVSRVLKPNGQFIFSTHHPQIDFESSVSKNYFETELLTQTWKTIGKPVEVQFYRRPLTELFKAIDESGMRVESLNEGKPDEKMKEISEDTYYKLKTNPAFLFIKCVCVCK